MDGRTKDGVNRPWQVVDRDGRIMRRATTYKGANRLAERFNQEYGAVRYSVQMERVAYQLVTWTQHDGGVSEVQ